MILGKVKFVILVCTSVKTFGRLVKNQETKILFKILFYLQIL